MTTETLLQSTLKMTMFSPENKLNKELTLLFLMEELIRKSLARATTPNLMAMPPKLSPKSSRRLQEEVLSLLLLRILLLRTSAKMPRTSSSAWDLKRSEVLDQDKDGDSSELKDKKSLENKKDQRLELL